jgi:hypothetical protein
MLRLLIGGLVLAGSLTQAAAQGTSAIPARPDSARALPMHFEWRQEGPAEVCGNRCLIWISAVGVITTDTPREFAKFVQGRDARGATLVLDSDGGSVHGALALGRLVRRLNMTTAVGRTIPLASDSTGVRAKLSSRADCESMCAFVLLAGNRRYVPPEANVRVHQIWLGDRRDDATAASYSAEDMVLVQRDIGRLAQYTVEMDGSVDLLEMALRIPPWEPMRRLSSEDQRRMRLNNLDSLFDRSASDAATTSTTSSLPTPTGARKPPALGERGWFTVERAGHQTLARRHPLTLEGEDIGSFELTFACTETADAYAVTYAERRTLRADASEHLKKVNITLGGRTIALEVASSEPSLKEVASVARGTVPASVVKYLADTGNRSVTVAASSNSANTVIRVGNSGIVQPYARLASACGKLARARAVQMSSSAGRPAEAAK